jgi:tripartite ATP-independent transporter DctM subunit
MDAFVLLGSFARAHADRHAGGLCPGLAALVGALWIDLPLDGVMIQIASGVNKFSLLAIPFFVLAGAIMAEGGMARRLVAFAGVLVGFMRGGLSLVNILASTFFGAISGSSVADTASIGSVLIPEMEKKGYPRDFATAVTVSGSVQAILIPPSHNAVIYSLAAGGSVSVAALFMAGVLPGLLLGLTWPIYCLYVARASATSQGRVIPLRQALRICVDALWGLMTMVIILGRHHVGRVHRHRVGLHRGGVGVLRHDVHLPRLQVARPAQADAPHGQDGVHRDDPDRLRGELRLHHDADADPA